MSEGISKCSNCNGSGRICRRCGVPYFPMPYEPEREPCNGNAPHEFVVCPVCGGKGQQ